MFQRCLIFAHHVSTTATTIVARVVSVLAIEPFKQNDIKQRVRRQVDSFLPTDLEREEEQVETVNTLPENDRIEAVAGQEDLVNAGDDVPVVEQLPVADRVAGLQEEGDHPVAEVDQLPQSDRVAAKGTELDLLGSEKQEEDVIKPGVELPIADRVEEMARDEMIPDKKLLVVEKLPSADCVKEKDVSYDTIIANMPAADKVEEYPDDNLPMVESFPQADSIKIDTMYADDAPATVRIPPETQKTALNPERVVDGKITDDVDIEAVKQLDHWEPEQQPIEVIVDRKLSVGEIQSWTRSQN